MCGQYGGTSGGDTLIHAGELAIKRQNPDGSMPIGKNGPHDHNMTPARNTGHFAILFLNLYKQTSDERWRIASQKALDHLLTLQPLGGSFWHRKEDFKNSYNGLIGQAWTLEALCYGHRILDDRRYLVSAMELIEVHTFDEEECLWYQADLDGSSRSIEVTLNQQIWFMALSSKICHDDQNILRKGGRFLSKLEEHMNVHKDGLLFTRLSTFNEPITRKLFRTIVEDRILRNRTEIETGYHVFALTGLTMLYDQYSDHPFFESRTFERILDYCFSRDYLANLLSYPRYGFEYNVVGFELPFIYTRFRSQLTDDAKEIVKRSYVEQLRYYSRATQGLLACNSFDIETLAARIYEIYRIEQSFLRELNE